MSTEKTKPAEAEENQAFSTIKIDVSVYRRIVEALPAICRKMSLAKLSPTNVVHHFIEKGLQEYEG